MTSILVIKTLKNKTCFIELHVLFFFAHIYLMKKKVPLEPFVTPSRFRGSVTELI